VWPRKDEAVDCYIRGIWIEENIEEFLSRVEAGLNTFTVALRVVGGDE
jgi:hypothetical protein